MGMLHPSFTFLLPFFYLFRAIQGCPLSRFPYVLTMEALACSICAHPSISGILLPVSFPHLPEISLYSDDTSVIATSDMTIRAVFKVYNLFQRASGSKMNISKSKGLCLGSWRNCTVSPVAIEWVSSFNKVLGIFIGFDDIKTKN